MKNDIAFQIVCAKCGCLSIKIEAPLKASRQDIVYCGDCGSSRGTVGELRDLAVQRYPDVVFSTPPLAVANGDRTDAQPINEMSKRYAELRRLRQQVELAEWLARESHRPPRTANIRSRQAISGLSRISLPGRGPARG